jgi:hypothetical protein
MATSTRTFPALPTPEELDRASYAIGAGRSDLDNFAHVLDRQDLTIEEAAPLVLAGEPVPAPGPLSREQLARLVVFAADMLDDAEAIAGYARRIAEQARHLYHENVSPEELAAYRESVRAWHTQESTYWDARSTPK